MVDFNPPDIEELSQQKRREIEQRIDMLGGELERFHSDAASYFSSLLSSEDEPTPEWEHGHFNQIEPIEFEALVADLWSDMGYQTKVTDPGKDGGVDVIADERRSLPIGAEKIAIQVKRYTTRKKVRQHEVDRMEAVRKRFDADIGLLVTTAVFSADAADVEDEDALFIELIDGDELLEMLNQSSLTPDEYI